MQNLALFDVKGYLEDKGIPYATSGENISPGWIGIDCPSCHDTKNHFGINLRNKLFSCWRCGSRGNPFTLVRLLEDTQDSRVIQEIIKKYYGGAEVLPDLEYPDELQLPKEFIFMEDWLRISKEAQDKNWALSHEQWAAAHITAYLQVRGYPVEETIKKYKLMWTGILGKWSFRMIIPVFMNGHMVNFAGRAVSGQEPKYKNCPNARAPMPINDTIYGYDEIQEGETLVLVEGPLDRWRLGKGSYATWGLTLTNAQANLLYHKKPKKLVFLYDADVREDREKLTVIDKSIAKIWYCPVEVFIMDSGDPDSLRDIQARELMEKLLHG